MTDTGQSQPGRAPLLAPDPAAAPAASSPTPTEPESATAPPSPNGRAAAANGAAPARPANGHGEAAESTAVLARPETAATAEATRPAAEWRRHLLGRLSLAGPLVAMLPLVRPFLLAREVELVYWQDRLLDFVLVAAILLYASGLGSVAVRRLRVPVVGSERALFAAGLGLPLVGWALFLLALPGGLLKTDTILGLWAGSALLIGPEIGRAAADLGRQIAAGWRLAGRGFAAWTLPTVFAYLLLIALVLLTATEPPVAYDALMYHLATPKEMLEAGGLLVTQHNQGNYPFTAEMLFLLGLVFGSDVISHLLHTLAAGLLGWTVWVFAARWGGQFAGTIALAALLTIRTTPALAPIAYVDLFWALWEVLAVFALARWAFPVAGEERPHPPAPSPTRRGGGAVAALAPAPSVNGYHASALNGAVSPDAPPTPSRGGGRGVRSFSVSPSTAWLVLAGLLFGAALGAKYIALMGFAVVGPVMFLWGWRPWAARGVAGQRAAFVAGLRAALVFGVVAVAVAAPWYVKNWAWLGSPLYPWFGVNKVSGEPYDVRAESYGLTASPEDLVSLPFRVYSPQDLENYTFSHVEWDTPSLLFLLAPLFLFAWGMSRTGWWLLLVFVLRAGLWAVVLQDTRYLYPGFALLCVPLGMALARVADFRLPAALGRPLVGLACFIAVLWPIGVQAIDVRNHDPGELLRGDIDVHDYLFRHDPSARGVNVMNQVFPDGSKVLLINDRRTYYLRHPYRAYEGLPQILANKTDEEMWALLRSWGVTHIALGDNDLGWFDMREAPARIPLRALRNFVGRGGPERLALIYRDDQFELYEILPQGDAAR